MNNIETESKITELSKQIDALFAVFKLCAVALLILLSLVNTGVALSIQHYQLFFRDELGPDHPLPNLTLLVFNAQTVLLIATFLWPLLGASSAFGLKKIYPVAFTLLLLVIIVIIQVTLT